MEKVLRKFPLAIALWLLLFSGNIQPPDELRIEVKDQRISTTPVSKYIFGNFVEAGFGRQVSGMWSEMIYNRRFV